MNRRCAALAVTTLFAFATFCGSAVAQSVEDQLKKLETERAAATMKGDIASLEKQTSDDFTFIDEDGQMMMSRSQWREGYKSSIHKIKANDLSEMKVRVYGETAVVTGKGKVNGVVDGKNVSGQYVFTRVWVKKGESWQSVAFQRTRVSKP
jgi:ketosteroid isomerase-like protein